MLAKVSVVHVALFLSACVGPAAFDAKAPSQAQRADVTHADVATPLKPRAFGRSSAELLAALRFGWNLGNALDAPDGETAWGNPKTTPALLHSVANAGFRLVRIPVTWSRHTGPAPDFTIEPAWLARVEEVVGYAHAAGLYAVINLHHDGAEGYQGVEWIQLNDAQGNPTEANNEAVRARFVAVWRQIAKHFEAYGEELLFESMNEIHHGYAAPDPRHFAIINDLNQRFVDVVRASGVNNAQRHLIVPGYNTNIEHTLRGFQLPSDPTARRLSLSVHYYDPYLFTMMGQTHTWGKDAPARDDFGQEDFVKAQFDRLRESFIARGVPVFMGEYGAIEQAGFEDYRRYWLEYVTKAAVDRGIFPVYWDNGGAGDGRDQFALIDRHTNAPVHPEMLNAIVRAATSAYSLDQVRPPAATR